MSGLPTYAAGVVAAVALLAAGVGPAAATPAGQYGPTTVDCATQPPTGADDGAPLPADGAGDSGPRLPVGSEVSLGFDVTSLAVSDVPPTVLVPLAGYSRFDDSDPLNSDLRARLYETVAESPGTYLSELAATADVPVSTVRYHVRVLEREGVVETERIRGKRRLFPGNAATGPLDAALNDASTEPILRAVRREEPVSVSGLADSVDRAASTVSYHLARLEDADLVERARDGTSVRVSLTPATRAALRGPSN
jgi:DNA-binding transcriptional ArsR family regulator